MERLDTCVGVSSSLYLLPLDTVLRGAVGPRVVVFGEILGPADASLAHLKPGKATRAAPTLCRSVFGRFS